MKTEIDKLDTYEQKLVTEILRLTEIEKKCQDIVTKLPPENRVQFIKSTDINSGMLAGISKALTLYREGKAK